MAAFRDHCRALADATWREAVALRHGGIRELPRALCALGRCRGSRCRQRLPLRRVSEQHTADGAALRRRLHGGDRSVDDRLGADRAGTLRLACPGSLGGGVRAHGSRADRGRCSVRTVPGAARRPLGWLHRPPPLPCPNTASRGVAAQGWMVPMSPTPATVTLPGYRRRVAVPRGGVAGPPVRRPLRPRRDVDGHLLPAVVPGADARSRRTSATSRVPAAAVAAGFRACRRCRPDKVSARPHIADDTGLVERALTLIGAGRRRRRRCRGSGGAARGE